MPRPQKPIDRLLAGGEGLVALQAEVGLRLVQLGRRSETRAAAAPAAPRRRPLAVSFALPQNIPAIDTQEVAVARNRPPLWRRMVQELLRTSRAGSRRDPSVGARVVHDPLLGRRARAGCARRRPSRDTAWTARPGERTAGRRPRRARGAASGSACCAASASRRRQTARSCRCAGRPRRKRSGRDAEQIRPQGVDG